MKSFTAPFALMAGVMVVLVVVLSALSILLKGAGAKSRQDEGALSGEELASISDKSLLTKAEQRMLGVLREALPAKLVMCQVSMYQTVRIDKGRLYNGIWNKLNRLTFDFVIVDGQTNVLAVVELDDRSHESASAKKRDDKKNAVMAHLRKPILRYQATRLPSAEQVRSDLAGQGVKVPGVQTAGRG